MEDFMKLLDWANDQGALSPVVSQFETKYFMDEETGPSQEKGLQMFCTVCWQR